MSKDHAEFIIELSVSISTEMNKFMGNKFRLSVLETIMKEYTPRILSLLDLKDPEVKALSSEIKNKVKKRAMIGTVAIHTQALPYYPSPKLAFVLDEVGFESVTILFEDGSTQDVSWDSLNYPDYNLERLTKFYQTLMKDAYTSGSFVSESIKKYSEGPNIPFEVL